jgi:hypothetical protein
MAAVNIFDLLTIFFMPWFIMAPENETKKMKK